MTQKTPGKHRMLKWTGGILAVLIILLGSAALYIGAKWKPFLTQKIKEGVDQGSQHLYKIDFDDLHVNVLNGSITIDSLKLRPDTAVYNQLRKVNRAPIHIFDIKMARLRLTRIGFFTAYTKKRINMNAIILDHASVNMIHHNVRKFQDTVNVEKTLYEQISNTLKSVHIRTIKILDADFDYLDGETAKTLNSVKHVNVNVTDVLVDSLSQYDTTRFYYSRNVDFEVAGYRSVTKDKMYTLKVDSVSGSASKGSVRLTGVQMVPMYEEMAFSKRLKTQKDRYDLLFKNILIRGLDFARINSDGQVYAQALKIGPAKVKIFRDKGVKPGNENKSDNFPHMALQKLELPLILDSVLLNNVDIAYTEYNPISQKRGTVNIDNLRGALLNVTNDSLQISKNRRITANLKARMVKAADLDIHLNFDLKAKDAAFTYRGNVGSFNMKDLNPIAVGLGLVAIESGRVQKIDFDLAGNKVGARGQVRMYYSDLKVQLLKEGEDGEPIKKKGLLSFLANTLVIYDSNPAKGKPLRVAQVDFKRASSSSFFSLLWKGLFSGMREQLGIGGMKTEDPQKARQKIVDKQQERKERRQEKREKRKKERQEKREKKQNE